MYMKLTKYIIIGTGYTILLLILWQLFHYSAIDYRSPGTGPDIQAQLNWIGDALRQNAGENTQEWYPEGYYFAHALYGYALVNQALLNRDNSALVERNAREVEWVLNRLESEKGLARFPREQAIEYGVFYQGWLNRLVGGLLLIEPNNQSRETQFHRQTAALVKAIEHSPTYQLEAYPGNCWPVDNVIAITSLKIHDDLYGTEYSKVINHWLGYVQTHLDPATGLIPHQINADTGQIIEGARGSSQVLLLSFLPELDSKFANLQYGRFRSLYTQTFLDFVLVREYQQGSEGFGDVDSGLLIGGLSPVASGVMLGTAHANGDEEIFERTLQLSEVLGVPIELGDEKRFAFGQLVVGDGFLVWGKTITPWTTTISNYEPSEYPRLTSKWEYWIFGIALLISIILCSFAIITFRQSN